MEIPLSNLANNLAKEIHEIKCKYGHYDKNVKLSKLNKKIAIEIEYTNFKDIFIEYKFLCCYKNYQKKFDENLKERFVNA